MTDFTSIAPTYRQNSLVQASAGEVLLELLDPAGDADILDVGCGAGNLTALLRGRTSGRVVGVDQARGMLREAERSYAGHDIEFVSADSANLPFISAFDAIFCNSAVQWFAEPAVNLASFHRALRPGGRVAVQAPATRNYCPNFLQAIAHCRRDPELDDLFAGFHPPWFFRDTAEEYRALFEEAGFKVASCRIDAVSQPCSVEKALAVFKSGAAAGYLNQAFFTRPLPEDFADRVLSGIRESFKAQADDEGMIDLLFHRVFVLAEKP